MLGHCALKGELKKLSTNGISTAALIRISQSLYRKHRLTGGPGRVVTAVDGHFEQAITYHKLIRRSLRLRRF